MRIRAESNPLRVCLTVHLAPVMVKIPRFEGIRQDFERMYLDPGSTSLFIQSLFALLATVFAFFGRTRLWLVSLWTRTVSGLNRVLRRR